MTDDEKELLFKVLNSYKVNLFSNKKKQSYRKEISIKVNRKIGNAKFYIELCRGDIILEVSKYYYTQVLLQYNISTDSLSLLINKGKDLDSSLWSLSGVSMLLEEDEYFQQSLVQKLPLEYNDFCRMISDALEIQQIIFKRFGITEQETIDVK